MGGWVGSIIGVFLSDLHDALTCVEATHMCFCFDILPHALQCRC